MAISKFKATCLAALERVRKTGRTLRVTRFGEPVADIVPPSPSEEARAWIGCMADTGEIAGDVVSPVVPEKAWRVLES